MNTMDTFELIKQHNVMFEQAKTEKHNAIEKANTAKNDAMQNIKAMKLSEQGTVYKMYVKAIEKAYNKDYKEACDKFTDTVESINQWFAEMTK